MSKCQGGIGTEDESMEVDNRLTTTGHRKLLHWVRIG